MTQNKNTIDIPTGSSNIVKETIERMNTSYKTDFVFLGSEDRDGVEFSMVKKGANCSDNMIFMFGFFYGCKINELRQKGMIDW